MTIDVTELTDQELAELLDAVRMENSRRQGLQSVMQVTPGLADAYMVATGRDKGQPFVKPTGTHNAYPLGWTVTHNGLEWEPLREGATEVPGESGDWRQVAEEGEILDWIAPTGAHNAYLVNAIVRHKGEIWQNIHTGPNGWEPGSSHSQWIEVVA